MRSPARLNARATERNAETREASEPSPRSTKPRPVEIVALTTVPPTVSGFVPSVTQLTPVASAPRPATSDTRALTELVELMFFAYRDFTRDADKRLAERGFGRAHHRVIYFVSRHPGLAVHDLLQLLQITKQSLAPVLKQLIRHGFIEQQKNPADRRERLLYPTPNGRALAAELTEVQIGRLRSALSDAELPSEAPVRAFLLAMVSEEDRADVGRRVASGPTGTAGVLVGNNREPAGMHDGASGQAGSDVSRQDCMKKSANDAPKETRS